MLFSAYSYASSTDTANKSTCHEDKQSPLSVKVSYDNKSEWMLFSDADTLDLIDFIEDVANINLLITHIYEAGYESQKKFLHKIIIQPKLFKLADTTSLELLSKICDSEFETALFSSAVTPRLKYFLSGKTINRTVNSLSRHAYSLLLTMRVFNELARNISRDTSINATIQGDCSSALAQILIAQSSSDINCAVGTTEMAFDPTNSEDEALNFISQAMLDAFADDSELENASNLAVNAALLTLKSSVGSVYSTSETCCFLYLLKCFNDIASQSYDVAFENIINLPEDNIFISKDRWTKFKEEWLVSQERAQGFLAPWLLEIDSIVDELDSFKNEREA